MHQNHLLSHEHVDDSPPVANQLKGKGFRHEYVNNDTPVVNQLKRKDFNQSPQYKESSEVAEVKLSANELVWHMCVDV